MILGRYLDLATAVKPLPTPVGGMHLSEFATARRVIRVRSAVLGDDVFLASDNADLSHLLAGAVAYRARELALLVGETPDGLRLVHETKRHFGAELEAGD